MKPRHLIPASESIIYGAIALESEPTTTDTEVLSDPAVWQHTEGMNPADDGQRLIKVWRHDDTRPSGYATRLYIIDEDTQP